MLQYEGSEISPIYAYLGHALNPGGLHELNPEFQPGLRVRDTVRQEPFQRIGLCEYRYRRHNFESCLFDRARNFR
jgi:hypothetical protein